MVIRRFATPTSLRGLAGSSGERLGSISSERRKTVTVLFCDVVGSTSLGEELDPESLRSLLKRYFEAMKRIVELHGGTVEKFIGDAVMAVFGVPTVHEDDALRAVRAAVEMRSAVRRLGVEGRIGVMSGEVVVGTEERIATGEAVNVAARLEQNARPGEVLIGEATLRLARDACEVEPVGPLRLKGKSQSVSAFRLLHVHEARMPPPGPTFVGRRFEMDTVVAAWKRVVEDRLCELLTVVGDAGLGKSRLAAELGERLDARVVRGRCLPYGEGITYWPVAEVLKQLAIVPRDDHVAAAASALLENRGVGTSADEIAWAFRKILEEAAATRPLLVVFDDIHWGGETFLDLVEHVALFSLGAPILLLCLARPELTELRPTWPITLRLQPLAWAETEELIPSRLEGPLRQRIADAAGGNPLFIHEIVAMTDGGRGDIVVPPTLQALLAARLDQLEEPERTLLECGAVEGEVFHSSTLHALASHLEPVTPHLATLILKQLIRPTGSEIAGEDAFSFCHLLMRDTAYAELPKRVRADLHATFARWIEEHRPTLVGLDEIVGYHLERACTYRAELGLEVDDATRSSARSRLVSAGTRARERGDLAAAVRLLERARTFVPAGEIDLPLEIDLAESLFWAGRGSDALRDTATLVERAVALGDRSAEQCGRIKGALFRTLLEPEGATEQLADLLAVAIPEFTEAQDDFALSIAYQALCQVAIMRGRTDAMLDAADRAAEHGLRAGRPYVELTRRGSARFYGTTPASDLLAWLDEQRESVSWSEHLDARQSLRALALAMLGRFDEARATLDELLAVWEDRGGGISYANVLGHDVVDVERWAGNPAAAAEAGARAMPMYEELGEQSYMSTAAGKLAQALYELDRFDEAEHWARRAASLGATDDVYTQMLWRQVRAKLLAHAGDVQQAKALAREAVTIAGETEMLDAQGDAWADLAEVLRAVGEAEAAECALRQALQRYERKQNLASLRRLQSRWRTVPFAPQT